RSHHRRGSRGLREEHPVSPPRRVSARPESRGGRDQRARWDAPRPGRPGPLRAEPAAEPAHPGLSLPGRPPGACGAGHSTRARARGVVVLSDRYTDATLAYQGYGQGLDLQTIHELNALATGGLLPDLTLLLDLDPGVGVRRIAGRPLDAFERMDVAFHQRVR